MRRRLIVARSPGRRFHVLFGSLAGRRRSIRGLYFDGAYFDHVVVGGGASGCVVAARLSEHGDRNVLLIEAGPWDTDPDVLAPRGVFRLQRGAYDWSDVTVPQPGVEGRDTPMPRLEALCASAGSVLVGWIVIRRQHRQMGQANEVLVVTSWCPGASFSGLDATGPVHAQCPVSAFHAGSVHMM